MTTLEKGQSIKLTECDGVSVWVERSGNGRTVTYFRQTKNGFKVIKQDVYQGYV